MGIVVSLVQAITVSVFVESKEDIILYKRFGNLAAAAVILPNLATKLWLVALHK